MGVKKLIADECLAGSGRREPRTSCIMYEGQPTATVFSRTANTSRLRLD